LPRLFSAGFASLADPNSMSARPGLAEEEEMCSFLSVLYLPNVTSFLLQILISFFNRSLQLLRLFSAGSVSSKFLAAGKPSLAEGGGALLFSSLHLTMIPSLPSLVVIFNPFS
jgi:hypothetical protein